MTFRTLSQAQNREYHDAAARAQMFHGSLRARCHASLMAEEVRVGEPCAAMNAAN